MIPRYVRPRRRLLVAAMELAAIGVLLSPVSRAMYPSAQDSRPLAVSRAEATPVTRTPLETSVVIEGHVLDAGGLPVRGAVVVSSAGGQSVSESDGSFRLEVAHGARGASVNVTAVASGQGGTSTGSVTIAGGGSVIRTGLIFVRPEVGCSPAWLPTFGGEPGVGGNVLALAAFDDGSGAALYVGGSFTAAGGMTVNYIAKWNGSRWSSLDGGMSGTGTSPYVQALTVFDDGNGPALYAGGGFRNAGGVAVDRVAKWNGTNWSALSSGMSSYVESLTVFDDGSGPALVAGGSFTTAGGVSANRIAKWNGSTWSALGSGMNSNVQELAVLDDGGGPALFAGGWFTTAGGAAANRVAKWNGSSWSALSSGTDGVIEALAVFDDGSGSALYAGGSFSTAGGVAVSRVAKWNGSSWSSVSSGMSGGSNTYVWSLAVVDDGGGAALYAGGDFASAGGVAASRIAKWNGSSWSALGSGVDSESFPHYVGAITGFDDGSGAALYAGGDFTDAGGVEVNRIAKWQGASWSALGGHLDDNVEALAVFDDGSGPALFAGGRFTSVGGVAANGVAKWNGSSWSPLGSGIDAGLGWFTQVLALAVFDDGGGPALYAGGDFGFAGGVLAYRIAKWDGSTWSTLGSGVDGDSWKEPVSVHALTVFDDGSGPALYAGGWFTSAGGAPANSIAKWNGTSWSTLSSGVGGGPCGKGDCYTHVYALTVFDDGAGPALYAGGDFTIAGSVFAGGIAKWNGTSWSALSGGMDAQAVNALTVFDDGGGPALFAGGYFLTIGFGDLNSVARWDGSSWSGLGIFQTDCCYGAVHALSVADVGSGPALYAGGEFTFAKGVPASYIAKLSASSWSPLGSGMSGEYPLVMALTGFDDGDGIALYAGGWFTAVPDSGDSHLAKWRGCRSPGSPGFAAGPRGAGTTDD